MASTIIERLQKPDIRKIFDDNNVAHVYLFGSFARGEETPESDVDIVYVRKNGERLSLFNLGNMCYRMEEVLERKVDLVSRNAVKSTKYREIRENIEEDMIPVF